MEYKLFQNNLEDANRVTKYLMYASATLLFLNSMLIFLCISISHRNIAVLVPMNLNAPMIVSNNSVSSQYLTQSALSFVDLRLNFDPSSIGLNHSVILRDVASQNYSQIKKMLDEESSIVKSQGISSSFFISNIEINKKMLAVLVSGRLVRSVGHKTLPSVSVKFQIDFKNNNGLLKITRFFEVVKNEDK